MLCPYFLAFLVSVIAFLGTLSFQTKKAKLHFQKNLALKSGVFLKNWSTEFSMYWFGDPLICHSMQLRTTNIYFHLWRSFTVATGWESTKPHLCSKLSLFKTYWWMLEVLSQLSPLDYVVLYGPILHKVSKIRQVKVESSTFIK